METLILAVLRQYSRQSLCFTMFAKYFLHDQIKSGNGIWPPFSRNFVEPFSRNFVEFMLKSGVFGE
jgi:hypothetical protein